VPTRGTQDEFDQLAGNLNRMLDQIEKLMGGIRHVGDSIAHDLRTPLTRLRHSLEEATRGDDIDAMRVDLQAAIDDADGLLSTFSALLRIARLESGSYLEKKESVALSTLVADAIELYEAVADERNLEVASEVDCKDEIPGDRDLIFQMVVNLLDNALKYTPEGGKIDLSVQRAGDMLVLTVADTGPGIEADQIDKITDRFYRIDPSRQQPGSGLGLALVQAVADHHGASLAFSDNAPGLRVRVSFHL
jgi:signal transduction histidine kinase